jgi:hypothetical protein
MKLWSSSMTLKQNTAVFNGKIGYLQGNVKMSKQYSFAFLTANVLPTRSSKTVIHTGF